MDKFDTMALIMQAITAEKMMNLVDSGLVAIKPGDEGKGAWQSGFRITREGSDAIMTLLALSHMQATQGGAIPVERLDRLFPNALKYTVDVREVLELLFPLYERGEKA